MSSTSDIACMVQLKDTAKLFFYIWYCKHECTLVEIFVFNRFSQIGLAPEVTK